MQFDKVVHFALYLPLGVLLARALALPERGRLFSLRRLLAVTILGGFYGVTDEIHQLFVPFRSCSLADCTIDFAAAGAGGTLWRAVENAVKLRNVAQPASASGPGETT